jgi:hypothetical protein
LGLAKFHQHDYVAAAESLNTCRSLGIPEDYIPAVHLALGYVELGDVDKAKPIIEVARQELSERVATKSPLDVWLESLLNRMLQAEARFAR